MPRLSRSKRHHFVLVAVAGASGRLGLHVLHKLKARHMRCVALVRSRAAAQKLPKGMRFHLVDYSDVDSLARSLSDVTHIVNCTGSPDSSLSMHELMAANVLPTKALLFAAPPHLQRFVHISSIAVYGWNPKAGGDEFSPRHPDTPYGQSKLAAERLVLAQSHNRPVVVLQPGMIYGPNFHAGFWPALHMIEQGRMKLLGSGSNRLPLVHADDVAGGIICALGAPVHSGSVFLLVSPEEITQEKAMTAAAHEMGVIAPQKRVSLHLARLLLHGRSFMRRLHGRPAQPADAPSLAGYAHPASSITPELLRQMSSDRFFDCSRARTLLHWRAAVPFKIGLRQVVSQYESSHRGESYG